MVNAAQCHGKARERKGSARKEKGRAAEKKRKKKMGMERMREFTLWRIFDFTNYIKLSEKAVFRGVNAPKNATIQVNSPTLSKLGQNREKVGRKSGKNREVNYEKEHVP